MPTVLPVSDLQRNLGSISDECHKTHDPIYLTKNGRASLVVMDSAAFDAQLAIVEEVRRREERVARSISRGYDDLLNGRTRSWAQAKQDAQRLREARHGA